MLETIKYLLGLQATATIEQTINGTPVIITPPGFEITKLEHLREEPTRIDTRVSIEPPRVS